MPETISDAIVNAPIVILAGAGASQHLGYPVATEFLEQLDERVQEEYFGDPPTLIVWDSAKEYRDCDDIDGTAPNFEDIYDRLEAAIESEWLYKDGPLPEGGEGGTYTPDRREAAMRLRELVLQEIVMVFGAPPDLDELLRDGCWWNLIRAVHPGAGSVLPVFTTNYDVALEAFFSHFHEETGYEMRDAFNRRKMGAWPWQAHRYTSPVPLHDDTRYVWLSHLHGCTAWYKAKDLDPPVDPTAPAYYYTAPDGSQATAAPIGKRALIAPSRKKRPFEDPHWTEFRYFLRCLDSTKTLLIIGHGLEDPHIVGACTGALGANAGLRIVVLSLDADKEWYRDRLPVRRLDEGRVAFVRLAFERDTMRSLQLSREEKPRDIEVALRAVAWCSADSCEPAECVDFDDTWKPYAAGLRLDAVGTRRSGDRHKERWIEGSESNWVFYEAQTASKEHSFLLKEMSPARVLEGEITIEVDDAGLNSWGALALAWLPADSEYPYPRFYAVENQGGDVKLKKSLGRGGTDHEELCDLGPLHVNEQRTNERRIWFRISHSTVQVAALTDDGGVIAAHSQKRDDTGWPLASMALVATNVTKHSIIFQNLKIIRRS